MPISLIPGKKTKEKVKFKLKLNKISRILIGTLLFLFLVFGILQVFQIFQSSSLKDINAEIEKIDKEADAELREEIRTKMKNLNQAKTLLESRAKIESVFNFIEKNTFSEVKFSNFSLNVDENEIFLQGSVSNALSLIIQTSIFKQLEEIKKMEIGGVIISKDGINFSLKLNINRSYFVF